MAKNMTRKGLAFGAALSLSVAGLASPASAAPGINLSDLNERGLYGMAEGSTFTFLAAGNSDFQSGNASQLRVKVTNVDGSANAPTELINGNAATAENLSTGGTTDTAIGTDAGDTAVFRVATMTSPLTFSLTSGAIAADESESYQVQVWADADNDGVIDSDEYASPVRTVTFVEQADIVTTTSIDLVTVGDEQITGTIAFGNSIDAEQLTVTDLGVYLYQKIAGVASEIGDATGDVAAVAMVLPGDATGGAGTLEYDADTNAFAFSTEATKDGTNVVSLEAAVVANSAVYAQPLYEPTGTPVKTETVGDAATAVAQAVSTNVLTADLVDSAMAENTGDTVPVGDATYQFKATVVDSSGDAVAGAAVTATVTTTATLGTGATDKSVVVAGTTHTAATTLPGATGVAELSLVTNADGEAFVTVSNVNFAAGDDVAVEFTHSNLASVSESAAATAATYTIHTTNTSDTISTTDGVAARVDFVVYDQWGGLLPDGYDLRAAITGATQTDATATGFAFYAPVVNGRTSISLLDDGTGTGTITYNFDLQERLAGGAYATAIEELDGFVLNIVEAADLVADTIAVTATTGDDADTDALEMDNSYVLENAVFGSYSSAAVLGTEPSLNAGVALSGVVKQAATVSSAEVTLAGVPVTFSGAGLQFKASVDSDNDGNVDNVTYAVGSITTYTDASGAYTVTVSSNTAGDNNLTITSMGASLDVVVTIGAAAARAGETLTIDIANAKAGQTMVVTGTLVDVYGNPVDTDQVATNAAGGATLDNTDARLSVSYDGPGFIVGSLPVETDADGQFEFRVLLGSNDVVTGTVTATYGGANGVIGTGDDDVTTTASLTAAVVDAAVATWTKNLNDGTVKMYAKNIVGAGKVQFMVNGAEVAWVRAVDATDPKLRSANGSYYLVRTVDLVEGQKNVLEIYVDGVRTKRTAYTY